MPGQAPASPRDQRPRRSPARTAGLAVIVLVSVYVSGVSTYRIFRATLFPPPQETAFGCRDGAVALYESVERARTRTASLAQPERKALKIFRSELEPTWREVHAIRAKCRNKSDKQALRALRSVELLRYAEERAVRYQAIDLTRWRKRAPSEVLSLQSKKLENQP